MQNLKQDIIAEIYKVKKEHAKRLAVLVAERNRILEEYKKTLNNQEQ